MTNHMKLLKLKNLLFRCDGCSANSAAYKLNFNMDNDSVYMCRWCLENLKKAVGEES